MARFLLVHGAWHGAWCWQRVLPLLVRAGHRAHAVTLTGVGERAHLLHQTGEFAVRPDVTGLGGFEIRARRERWQLGRGLGEEGGQLFLHGDGKLGDRGNAGEADALGGKKEGRHLVARGPSSESKTGRRARPGSR